MEKIVTPNNAIDSDAGKRCALPGARHRARQSVLVRGMSSTQ